MATSLSNLNFSNAIYTVTGSNPSGTLTINQPTTSFYTLQYSPFISSIYTHDYSVSVLDATSNISVSLTGSNMNVANQSSNLFSVSVAAYLMSNAYNVLRLQRNDNFLSVNINNVSIVRITNSNEMPLSYDNSFIRITASNAGQFSNVIFQPVATVDTPMQFNKPIKAISLTCSNVSACNITTLSNQVYTTNDVASSASNCAFNLSNTITPTISNASNTAVYASNASVYASNNLVKKSGDTITGDLAVSGYTTLKPGSSAAGGFTHFPYNGNGFNYIRGSTILADTSEAEMVGVGTASPAHKFDVVGNVNATSFSGSTITHLSNLGLFGSNSATFASNQSVLNTSNSLVLSNNFATLSNYTYNTITTQATTASNEIAALSNTTATNTANIATLSNSLNTTNTALTNYSNYESGRVSSLSNFAYSIQSSNSTTTIYTSNITTKTINADDGGTIGALLMSAAGLALGGYNLFNQNGILVNTLQDTLGNMKLYTNGLGEFQSLLSKTGRYTDSVQIGVSTIELSNNTIYLKDGNTSNTLITSNAITITNSNISTFTVSNANLVTNCNVIGANITSLSNVAYWASNNNINRNNEIISILNTDKILLPASANLISSGWDYTLSGWTPLGVSGGYVLRNGGEGSLEIYTGKSNSLGMSMTITSNGNVGVGTYFPTQKLDVSGNIKASGSLNVGAGYITGDGVNAICLTLSNNNSPSLSVWSSNSSLELGVSSINGGYSADANVGDAVIRCSSNIYLQSGQASSAICINSNNRVGINTKTPQYVLDVAGNTRLNNALIGDSGHGSAWSAFAHSNSFTITGYGFLQNNAGRTIINCQTGQTIGFRTGNTDWGIWNATGLCVGGIAPSAKLDVVGETYLRIMPVGAGGVLRLGRTDGNRYHEIYCTNSGTQAENKVTFNVHNATGNTNVTSVLTLNGAGNVGIGTSNPNHTLDVVGNVNATSYTGATITNLSNLAVWSSNTARYSSNYGATLCNLATDALTRGAFGSNAGAWASNNFIAPTVTDLSVTGSVTFPAGLTAGEGTYTYFPFPANGRNYIRGTTILADTSNAEFVGIGTANPTAKLHVNGFALIKELSVGNLGNLITHIGIREAVINGSGGASKVVTTFTSTFPSVCSVFPTVETESTYDDVFACSIKSKSTSTIKVITCRADGGGAWTQTLTLKILVVGI